MFDIPSHELNIVDVLLEYKSKNIWVDAVFSANSSSTKEALRETDMGFYRWYTCRLIRDGNTHA